MRLAKAHAALFVIVGPAMLAVAMRHRNGASNLANLIPTSSEFGIPV